MVKVQVGYMMLVCFQDCEIQVYGYKGVGDPQCLWTFSMKDSVLALDTEVDGGRVSSSTWRWYLYLFSPSLRSSVCLPL